MEWYCLVQCVHGISKVEAPHSPVFGFSSADAAASAWSLGSPAEESVPEQYDFAPEVEPGRVVEDVGVVALAATFHADAGYSTRLSAAVLHLW